MATTITDVPSTATVAIDAVQAAEGFNPRQQFDSGELERLQRSIERHGVLVPILITPTAEGGYRLVDGERRLRAAQAAGLTEIPALERVVDEHTAGLEQALVANQGRVQLNPVEEAQAFQRLIDAGLTRKGVAEEMAVSQKLVRERLELLELPEQLRPQIADGTIPPGAIKPLLALARIHAGLPVLAVARVQAPPADQWDDPLTWADLQADPIAVVCSRCDSEDGQLPDGVFEGSASYPVSRFALNDNSQRELQELGELLGPAPAQFTVRFDHDAVETAERLGAAHASSRGWAQLIVGQDVADQLAGDYITRCLEVQRDGQRRRAECDKHHATQDGGERQVDEEQRREQRKAQREAAAQERKEAVAFNADLGAAVLKHLSRVKVDERVLKILAAVDVHGDLDKIAARGARYGFSWEIHSETKTGKRRVEYPDPTASGEKAREFLLGAKTAADYAGRLVCLLVMARYAKEAAVAQSNRAFYTLSISNSSWSGSTVGLPWAGEVLALVDEIAQERLPEHLTAHIAKASDEA